MIKPDWVLKTIDQNIIEKIIKEFKVPEIFARVLANRNLTNVSESTKFFSTDLNQLHNPFLMNNMETAVDRVMDQLDKKKRILIFGDYDVDGICSSALLYMFFKSLGGDIQFYIPHRKIEGYGLSKKGIEYAQHIGADLLITCDCGISSILETEYANRKNIDIIITDHHKQGSILPKAHSILNPNQINCNYPFKGLCGAGVAFKFITAICIRKKLDLKVALKYCDLVSVAIAADVVPMLDENRNIMEYGIKLMKTSNNIGLTALLKSAGLENKELTVGRIIYKIAPKINAAGRLGDAARAVKLLTTKNKVYAWELVVKLEKENQRRQNITLSMIEDAIYQVNSGCNLNIENAIILASDDWHQGVIGIVASRIKELFYKPCILISFDKDGKGTGSARSISTFDIYKALSNFSEYFNGFGGHPMAAGLTIKKENFIDFKNSFINYANLKIKDQDLQPTINIDSELLLEDINSNLISLLKTLEPFGPGNMRPKFVIRNVKILGHPEVIGTDSTTLKFKIKSKNKILDVIGFNMVEHYEKLILSEAVDLAFIIHENDWMGNKSIQLEIKDIKGGGMKYD